MIRQVFPFQQGPVPTPATTSGNVAINLGDLWSDTSVSPPVLRICTSLSPIAFTAVGGSGGGPTIEVNGTLAGSQTLLNLVAGSNMTITDDGVGDITFTAAGTGAVNFADEETPSGLINGSNTTYTLAHTPNPAASLLLILNGLILKQGVSDDYTLSTSTITMASAPTIGDILLAWYRW